MTITQQKTEITQQSDDKTADKGIILRLANNSGHDSGTSTGPYKIWVLNPYNGRSIMDRTRSPLLNFPVI